MPVTNHIQNEEYDVIIAGGGTAACVIAGRLASADPSLSILVIEEGRNNYKDPTIRNPVVFLSHLSPGSKTAKFYKAKPSEDVLGREVIVPTGNVLGGGSSINFMLYTRAQGIDFDSWKSEGWYSDDMLPFLNKIESYHYDSKDIDPSKHGYEGPVHITKGFRAKDAEDEWMKVINLMGEREITDMQDLKACSGWSRWARYVSPDGLRQDAAHCYVHPLIRSGSYPKLHILVETQVQRVIFDERKRATGVEIVPNPKFVINTPLVQETTPSRTVRARKLVVVSCGSLGSPVLLERSGIGASETLDKIGVPVISDLPGVGENLQDHHLLLYPYKSSLGPGETIDGVLSGRVSEAEAISKENPQRSWNAGDISSKLRPTQREVDLIGGEFKELYDCDYRDQVEKPLILCAVHNGFFGDHSLIPEGQYMTVATYSAYPYSRGSIHAGGKTVDSPPDLDTGFLNREVDVTMLVWAYKKSREIMRRTSYYRGELQINHPEFSVDSRAALTTLEQAYGGKNIEALENLEYSKEDDAHIAHHIRQHVATTWHSLGTCAMKPRENGGVVNKYLDVHGVSGLKVADLSIAPENVGANTCNTALAIGEKAADIIAKELGLYSSGFDREFRQLKL
ncbi:alcohol dehydrogenase [Xylogone sp. PMI_703]|nr:alcohol dehydrogenase [Xylogone sp. PMI_703]